MYPLSITVISNLSMPTQASGSLVHRNGKVIGSLLIGQKFEKAGYFWPRPSAVNYNPLPSGASNLGPTSRELKKQVGERKEKIMKAFLLSDAKIIPADLLLASGSGLDPHISLSSAYFQMEQIAHHRKMQVSDLKKIIDSHIERRQFKILGCALCVNVLKLNLALDEIDYKVSE